MRLLDGRQTAARVREEVRRRADSLRGANVVPKLAAVLVGEDPASQIYVRNKRKACEEVGIASDLHLLSPADGEPALLEWIHQLNRDPAVHGILVQLPLPRGYSAERVLDAIHPWKDVDAFHAENVGLMVQGRPRFLPCTPTGIIRLLVDANLPTAGRQVVILGRSDIVGKPLGLMLMQKTSPWGPEFANATVTVAHSRSRDLPEITRRAEILVAAIGQPRFVTKDYVRDGAVVIDVGTNRLEKGLVGDVDFDHVAPRTEAITPVPGGVGPMTIAILLQNTVQAAEFQKG